jgi:RNA polymerase sigma-70 factor (ECF subfamily)
MQPPADPSSSLLAGACAGRQDAWWRLANLCAPVVARWCRSAGLQPADVDEVVQEVFRSLLGNLPGFHRAGSGSFAAWLYTITRTRILDHHRRRKKQPPGVGGSSFHERLEQEPAPEDSSLPGYTALYRRILDLLQAEFEEKTWLAFWRSAVEEQPTADIARELGLSVNAVRLAKSRVLRRLRQEFGDLLG